MTKSGQGRLLLELGANRSVVGPASYDKRRGTKRSDGGQRPGGRPTTRWPLVGCSPMANSQAAGRQPASRVVVGRLLANQQPGWSLVGCSPTASSPAGWPPTSDQVVAVAARYQLAAAALMADPRPVSSCWGHCHRRATLFVVDEQLTGYCWVNLLTCELTD